jgi:hypothetical protein
MELEPSNIPKLTLFWRRFSKSHAGAKVGEWLKLAKLAMCMVGGSVEDERTFSALAFLKNKQRNALNVHLELCVRFKTQRFFQLENFPYEAAIQHWVEVKKRLGGDVPKKKKAKASLDSEEGLTSSSSSSSDDGDGDDMLPISALVAITAPSVTTPATPAHVVPKHTTLQKRPVPVVRTALPKPSSASHFFLPTAPPTPTPAPPTPTPAPPTPTPTPPTPAPPTTPAPLTPAPLAAPLPMGNSSAAHDGSSGSRPITEEVIFERLLIASFRDR